MVGLNVVVYITFWICCKNIGLSYRPNIFNVNRLYFQLFARMASIPLTMKIFIGGIIVENIQSFEINA